MPTVRSWAAGAMGLLAALAIAAPAWAHGDIVTSDPAADAEVKRPPRQVALVLAEAPASGSALTVTDGCGDRVSTDPQRDGESFMVSIDGGRPGRWRVQLRSISSVDGHVISERFSFQVAGARDCSKEKPREPKDDEADIDTSSRPPIENEDQGSGFPIVPFALGTVAVVGVAVALRGGSRKKS